MFIPKQMSSCEQPIIRGLEEYVQLTALKLLPYISAKYV